MAYTLQQLSDMEDIRTLKHRYFRGIDTADMTLLADMFTDDIGVDYRGGNYRVRVEGRENFLDFLVNSFNSDAVAMHHGHMPEITLTGEDSAEGIWYLEDIFINLELNLHTIGIAIYRAGDLAPAQLLDLADQALYAAKGQGRDGVALLEAAP